MFLSTAAIAFIASLLLSGGMAAPNNALDGTASVSAPANPKPTDAYAYGPYASPAVLADPSTLNVNSDAAVQAKGVPPDQIVVVIRTVTTVSSDINVELTKVTAQLNIAQLTSISTVVVQGFTKIVADIGKAVAQLPGTPIISGGIADTVVEVLVAFVKVHQALLNTVIGKHSIFAQFGLTAPLAAVLRAIEAGVDAFAFAIIGLIPTKKPIIQKEISKLDVTVKSSISVYSQLCFPSPTFPKKMPTCIKLGP